MSDTNSDIDDTMAEADGDTAEQADSGAEEASELSIDEILGQADGEVAEVARGEMTPSKCRAYAKAKGMEAVVMVEGDGSSRREPI